MEMKRLLKTVEGILAGDGNAYDRMNAVEGGIGLSPLIYAVVDYCKANGITAYSLKRVVKTDAQLNHLLNLAAQAT